MSWQAQYIKWSNFVQMDSELKERLQEISDNEKLLEDSFYKNLDFGTGGMRGELGPGTNRMNIYTIRKASLGLANYIAQHGERAKQSGVVIAYDPRHKSECFALEAALVLGNQGIQVYLFDDLRPTPELSFAVRYLHAFAGIVITASHNPPEYNGYKVYGPDGGQLTDKAAHTLIQFINEIEDELAIEITEKQHLLESGLLKIIGREVDEAYIEKISKIVIHQDVINEYANDVAIVFTPLHGTANTLVQRALKAAGFHHVTLVKEQELPDPNFHTVSSPNPEDKNAFDMAVQIAIEIDADLILGTDPDGDRVGAVVKDQDGQYLLLTGNQLGCLMLEYILSRRQALGTLPSNGAVVKTIVTTELGRAITEDYKLNIMDTLTGFKYIGEKINEFENTGDYKFQYGFEESFGFLIGDFVRDKDAVQACVLVAELLCYYKSLGKTMYDVLLELYERYGYYMEELDSFTYKGIAGVEKIQGMLHKLRHEPPMAIGDHFIEIVEDYLIGVRTHISTNVRERIELPSSNVMRFLLDDKSWFCVRPSGTEPKVKIYYGVRGQNLEDSRKAMGKLRKNIQNLIGS